MFRPSNNRFCHYPLLLLVGILLYFVNLGGATLWDLDEGRNATTSMEMLRGQSWIIPTCNGELRVHKPVLLYWLQMGSYQVFGVNEFGARFPSALAGLLTILLVYELTRRLFDPQTALLSGIIFGSSVLMCAAARFANQDALLNFCAVLTFFLFYRHYAKTGRYPFIACGVAMALGFLAKGPVGVVLPAGIIGLYLFWERKLSILWHPKLLLGCVVFCLIAIPWYALVGVETKGEFLRGFFLKHNIGRALSPMEQHGGGPHYYLVVLLIGFAPWSVFAGLTLWYGFWSSFRNVNGRFRKAWEMAHDGTLANQETGATEGRTFAQSFASEYRLLWCWATVYLLAFTIAATKLPNYILPMSAPVAILLGRFFERWRRGSLPLFQTWCRFGFVLFVVLGLLVVSLLWMPNLAPSLFGPSGLNGIRWLGFVGILPIASSLWAWWQLNQNQRTRVVATMSIGTVFVLSFFAAYGTSWFNQIKSPEPLVAEGKLCDPERQFLIGAYNVNHLPSITFYAKRTVKYYWDPKLAEQFLHHKVPAYLFVRRSEWEKYFPTPPKTCRVVASHHDMYQHCEIIVVSNGVSNESTVASRQ
ncbi:MAG: ArnT family glycosyltransferase [Gemmataceae bacterium]